MMPTTPRRYRIIVLALIVSAGAWIFHWPMQNQSGWQPANQTKKYLHSAIYRFWSDAVPYCEQYIQFTDFASPSSASMTPFSEGKWQRLQRTAANRSQGKEACRYDGKPLAL